MSSLDDLEFLILKTIHKARLVLILPHDPLILTRYFFVLFLDRLFFTSVFFFLAGTFLTYPYSSSPWSLKRYLGALRTANRYRLLFPQGQTNYQAQSLVVGPISISTTKASFVGENIFVRSLLGVVRREGKPFLRSDLLG
jgi:hypothetical protein